MQPQTITIDAIGSIQFDKQGNIILYLMDDRNKDITHTIKLTEYASKGFLQSVAQLIWFKLTTDN